MSIINERRVRDAMTAVPPVRGAGETIESLDDERQALCDAIAAAQSTDDLGPEANDRIWTRMQTNSRRLRWVENRLAALRAAPLQRVAPEGK